MTSRRTPDSLPRESRLAMQAAHHQNETACISALLEHATLSREARARVSAKAEDFIGQVRAVHKNPLGFDAFMQEYELSTPEGVAMMCLAEALLRIPDAATQDALIRDKLGTADWASHKGQGENLFVNASTWALTLSGRFLDKDKDKDRTNPAETGWGALSGLATRAGEAVVREAARTAMRIMGHKFVLGRTVVEALDNARPLQERGFTYSYDILGEAAMTSKQAMQHFEGYQNAIVTLGAISRDWPLVQLPEISIKLSALHPRYEPLQAGCFEDEMIARVTELARQAAEANLGLTIDAEESERLDISLDVLDAVSRDRALRGWNGLGIALQAYQKRAYDQIGWLEELAKRDKRRIKVRLVKGAYWDREIKRAQVLGLYNYPVFTRKASSDVSYIACARRLLARPDLFFTAFASHNAHTIAAMMELVSEAGIEDFEFQKLHGMGDELFDLLRPEEDVGEGQGWPCRVYAPVGEHEDLLPYLVRRLLENGANSSFVNRIGDTDISIAKLVRDPAQEIGGLHATPHPRIVLPKDLFGTDRKNSQGIDVDDVAQLEPLLSNIAAQAKMTWSAGAIIGGHFVGGADAYEAFAPFDESVSLGKVHNASATQIDEAFQLSAAAQPDWASESADHRAACLERAADLYETHRAHLMAMCMYEGGKTLTDAMAEVREAVDFLRYYAQRARIDMAAPEDNPGPTGERNQTHLVGRGVFSCISPWNFPLAIFTGQIAAALVSGNAVVAKPAGSTPFVAVQAVNLLHKAGIPFDILHLAVGSSSKLSTTLLEHSTLGGVAFTGSVDVAHTIHKALAARQSAILPLIAETGGLNAMIVDSSALAEQVARDVITSAFHSGGQRCSALRALFVQDEVADKMIEMITGAMDVLNIGDPREPSTDIGPLIDRAAVQAMQAHVDDISQRSTLLARAPMDDSLAEQGAFFTPHAFEVETLDAIGGEVFGPILHIVRYQADKLDAVIDAINATGFGLTLGIHSRIEGTVQHVVGRARVGNIYVNRSQIGAVVGVQPFGGEGLSGTGPKAGGPRYLHRFCTERTVSVDTTASGGNASLMTLDDG
ncbi:MAG: bifunctional proline dehydrogenase/L-glutamate gamma-semialdehyde dehydrogenase PutA [Magnetovibrio sp.]|nr:bifunctional proline dehydrogenase/L-glutamate gamma-semialdehyde dehydrogenase PutA [Magnetovibrio sp.]